MKKFTTQPLLITGATGTLGNAFAMVCDMRGINYRLSSRREMDIANLESVEKFLEEIQPEVLINTAGFADIEAAEKNSRTCYRENTLGNIILADACKRRGIKYMTFSCDKVFSGEKKSPYLESDTVAPLNIYGRSKVRAERCVTQILSDAIIIRTAALFSPWDGANFLAKMEKEIFSGNFFFAPSDVIISPSYAPDLVNAALDLLEKNSSGIFHLANQGETSIYEFALIAAEARGLDSSLVQPRALKDFSGAAIIPQYSVLASEKNSVMPLLSEAIERYAKAMHEEKFSFELQAA